MRSFLTLVCILSAIPAAAFQVSYQIGTVAGSDWIGDGSAATRALLFQAEGIAADPSGNLYIADAANHRIRKVTRAGIISTFAGTGIAGFSGDGGPAAAAQLDSPYGLAYDGRGNLYIADLGNGRVRRVGADGSMSTIAGGGSLPAGGANEGSPATVVSLAAPRNLALDGYGSIYISDFAASCVYRLSQDGSLTTVAGRGIRGFSGDGMPAVQAELYYPTAVAIDRQGALYIADSQNHLIRKVVNGVISSIARAATPTGLAVDAFGTLYVADRSAGQILTIPVVGQATALNLGARDLTFGPDGFLYATDGDVVRRVSFSGPSTVVAGGATLASGDLGAASLARLNHPSGVAADASGNIYIADRDNNRIRRVGLDGIITTVAGTGDAGSGGDGGLAVQATLNSPIAVTVDAKGNLYIADYGNQRVRLVTAAGVILPIAVPGLILPAYVLADGAGNVYITDSPAGTILKVTPGGFPATVLAGLDGPRGLALDAAGNLYFTEATGRRVQRLGLLGDVVSLGPGVWSAPEAVTISANGDVLVADVGRQQILRVDSSGEVTPVAGNGASGFAGEGNAALSAELFSPWDVAAGPAGIFYIADLNNNRIRVLTPVPDVIANPIFLVQAVNAASLQPGPVAPGMLLEFLGTGLTAADLPDTRIVFGAIPAPLLATNNAGLVVQAPEQIAGLSDVQITIVYQGNPRAQITASVIDAAPALFVADGSGQAAALNEDGTLNSTANPAARGSVIVLYGTGEGVTGLPVSVAIDNIPAEVLYAGPVVGYPGLLQVNAVVPLGYITPGVAEVTIAIGQAVSQTGVNIEVK